MTLVEIYRDRWILVVDKPSGLPSQPARGGSDSVLGRAGPDARLPHRLDAAASGLLLLVLHPAAHKAIADGFRSHRIARQYLAVLDGTLVEETTWTRPVDGKPAHSVATPRGHGAGMTATQLSLRTGRKHQLRVHAAMAGHPIVGDRRYGDEVAERWPRLALHATHLALKHPIDGRPLAFHAPLPADLLAIWAEAGGPERPVPNANIPGSSAL